MIDPWVLVAPFRALASPIRGAVWVRCARRKITQPGGRPPRRCRGPRIEGTVERGISRRITPGRINAATAGDG
ncbi:hypothetical protein DFJ74DRAFT_681091 [Hyaloraphidium curvatum]|nr:hypothetical protein DFJ74DRAFT_681091 [Hyaloraphidium curvatum]